MKYRKLQISWSVAWGLAGILLFALWVRSYCWAESIDSSFCGRHVLTQSYHGLATILTTKSDFVPVKHYRWQEFDSAHVLLRFRLESPNSTYIFPYCAGTAIVVFLAAAPWTGSRTNCPRF